MKPLLLQHDALLGASSEEHEAQSNGPDVKPETVTKKGTGASRKKQPWTNVSRSVKAAVQPMHQSICLACQASRRATSAYISLAAACTAL